MNKWMIILGVLPVVGHLYLCWRVWHLLPVPMVVRLIAVLLITLPLLGFFLWFSMPLERMPWWQAVTLYQGSSSWLFIMIYLVLIFLALDLGRLVHLIPSSVVLNNWKTAAAIVVGMVGLFTYAYVHYNHKVRVPLMVTTSKPLPHPLKIVMAADLHLGYVNRADELERWIDLINAENADLILIAGDIIDNRTYSLDYQNMAERLHRLNAPVYACPGNHEYFSEIQASRDFYQRAGIHLLCDEAVTVEGINIVGRDDRTNPARKSIATLMQGMTDKFTIVLDHQPYHLDRAEKAGVDFQLSGHTHYGQVWPLNWIEHTMYQDPYGPTQIGNTQFYVTSGMGIWGAKFRIGTQSEYVVLRVES